MSSARKLFLVVLGGRCKGCHVEQHDVRWVVGETIDATLPALRQEWIGLRRGLHIDSYRCICLLYTSPSPRDLSTSRMPSSA